MPMSAAPPAGRKEGKDAFRVIVETGTYLDQTLTFLERSLPAGSMNFKAAREHVKLGIAKALAGAKSAPAVSPTATGEQFPGGGIAPTQ